MPSKAVGENGVELRWTLLRCVMSVVHLLLAVAVVITTCLITAPIVITGAAVVSKTIYVDPFGRGNFTMVQQAIDSIANNNKEWTRIKLGANVYSEKVLVVPEKTFILLEGESLDDTVIQWDEVGGGFQNATFAIQAKNFVARNIKFMNAYNQPNRAWRHGDMTWNTAVHVGADKVAFFNCAFIGQQDTVNDATGRHYFQSCYIEGFVDFIWGGGTSIYQDCNLYISTKVRPGLPGYITAQGRESANDTNGFVFNSGTVSGDGPAYLGRAYRAYSRVVFHKTNMADYVVPKGWDAWDHVCHEQTIEFAEEECIGLGSNKSMRVPWEKTLSKEDLQFLTTPATFIDQDGWLEDIPD